MFYNPFDLSVKGIANTGVVRWGGKTLALYEVGWGWRVGGWTRGWLGKWVPCGWPGKWVPCGWPGTWVPCGWLGKWASWTDEWTASSVLQPI